MTDVHQRYSNLPVRNARGKRKRELRKGTAGGLALGPSDLKISSHGEFNAFLFTMLFHKKPIRHPEAAPIGRQQRAGCLCESTDTSEHSFPSALDGQLN